MIRVSFSYDTNVWTYHTYPDKLEPDTFNKTASVLSPNVKFIAKLAWKQDELSECRKKRWPDDHNLHSIPFCVPIITILSESNFAANSRVWTRLFIWPSESWDHHVWNPTKSQFTQAFRQRGLLFSLHLMTQTWLSRGFRCRVCALQAIKVRLC